ncbi:MAG TPA: hypothetical protein VH331_12440 [Allosphingosinicella sp.]|jgi:hypothetical protein|nr:hypothetical protein [Allosphingosinicella sp.]
MTREKDSTIKRKVWQAPRVVTFEAGLAENNSFSTKDGGGSPGTNLS